VSVTTGLTALLLLAFALPAILKVIERPPVGVLVLAALAPFDGLLAIAPFPAALNGWKEALVVLIVGSSLRIRFLILAEQSKPTSFQPPAWALPIGGLAALALASAVIQPGVGALLGLKVGFFYLLVPLALFWVPFNARERDRLVTVLMSVGVIVALVAIVQQIVGAEFLVSLGYEYNESIRFASGILRSISTFNQPFAFAFFLMMVMLVGIPVALDDRRRLRNQLFLFVVPLLAMAMVTAVVRAAVLGLAVGAIWLALRRYSVIAHAVVPLVVIALLLPVGVSVAVLSSTSLSERSGLWSDAVLEQAVKPWGEGLGTTGAVAELQEEADAAASRFPSNLISKRFQADNYYIKTLVELGPVGLWLLLWGVALTFGYARSTSDRVVGPDSGLATGIAASILAAITAATVSSFWEIFPSDLFFWMLLGVVSSIATESSSTHLHSPREAAASKPTAASY